MDTYLGRPVFPFMINHAKAWSGSLTYDAKVRQVGGGAAIPTGIQRHSPQRFDLECVSSKLTAIEDFFDYVRGQAVGFWLPMTRQSMTVVAGVDTLSFLCKGTSLAARWGQSPAQYLVLTDAAGNKLLRAVASVVQSGTNSLVTLDADEGELDSVPTTKWSASLLLFVGLASDDLDNIIRLDYETFTFDCTVLERPFEYAEVDEPAAGIYLYALGYTLGTKESWTYWTNWGVAVHGTDGKLFINAQIEHGDITYDAEGSECDLKCLPWDGCPVSDLFLCTQGLPLRVKIWRAFWDWDTKQETGNRQLLFDGVVRKPTGETEISASCQGGVDLFNRPVPTKPRSRTCRAVFCDATCKLPIADYCVQGTVIGVSDGAYHGLFIQTTKTIPSGWLAHGLVGSADYHDGVPSKAWEWQPIMGTPYEITDDGSGGDGGDGDSGGTGRPEQDTAKSSGASNVALAWAGGSTDRVILQWYEDALPSPAYQDCPFWIEFTKDGGRTWKVMSVQSRKNAASWRTTAYNYAPGNWQVRIATLIITSATKLSAWTYSPTYQF